MHPTARRFLLAGSTLALALGLASGAQAQAWPDRPIRLIVGGPPGASADFLAHLTAEKVGKGINGNFVVENRRGAGGVVAVKAAITSKPDGYTFLMLFSDNVLIAPFMQKVQPYDPLKEVHYVGAMARSWPFILSVNPGLPVRNLEEFIKLVKSGNKKVSYSSYGLGSLPQLGYESLAAKVGIEFVHAPYKGGAESYQAAVAGDVDSVAGTSFIALVKSGKLRPLAIGGNKRSSNFPEVPTFNELGYGDQIFLGPIFGIVAPPGLPAAINDRFSAELKNMANAPDTAERLATVASEPFFASSEEMTRLMREGVNNFQPLIRKLGLAGTQ